MTITNAVITRKVATDFSWHDDIIHSKRMLNNRQAHLFNYMPGMSQLLGVFFNMSAHLGIDIITHKFLDETDFLSWL
ncbi:hypothetical protein D3C85_1133910 [compost metagenome]